MKATNAVILAAGKSSKFFPPLYDKPKGLFTFRGEVLIERQIEQLQAAGIPRITVVLGYEKEQFFYLEEKYGVDLVINTHYFDESNLASLDAARDRLGETFLCCADHWYENNPFIGQEFTASTRLVAHVADARHEFTVDQAQDGRLDRLRCGAESGLCLMGYAFLTTEFCQRLMRLYDAEKDILGVKNLHWEQFWGMHANELPLYGKPLMEGFHEFDSLGDLQRLDQAVLDNVSQEAISNICRLLSCSKWDIRDIEPLNKGLTNVSFSFYVGDKRYVYRHPGASASALVDRPTEVIAQTAAHEVGVDPSLIAIDAAGWKLSRYVEAVRDFDYNDPALLKAGIEQVKRFHASGATCAYTVDPLAEGDRLQELASSKKGDLKARHAELHERLVRLWHHVELDGWPKVLCHNDTYAPNWIVGADELCYIDWEYAAMGDRCNDLATPVVHDSLSQEKADEIIGYYFDGAPTFEQRRHAYAVLALCGWRWYNWGVFKNTLEEDGYIMYPGWKACKHYLPLALDMYENPQNYEEA